MKFKTLLFLLAALILSVGLVACQPTPTETVQAPPTTPTTPTTPLPAPVADFSVRTYSTTDLRHIAEFSNQSQNAVTYIWQFGDGITSSLANPNHEYSAAGTYLVRLTAVSKDNQQAVAERRVSVE